ncbi:MAG: NAD(P)-binding domain-containing protein, partial [Bacteroidota bacterium]
MTPIRFVLVGAGNVGTHLGQALVAAGHTATGVWSRVSTKAEVLAAQLGTNTISNLEHIPAADLIVLAVQDDAVPSVAAQLPPGDAVVVHTSGSVPMEVLAHRAAR